MCHYFGLYHREHGIPAAKTEQTYLEEGYEKLKEYHFL
jgi:hypothetical protein